MRYFNAVGVLGGYRPVVCDTARTEAELVFLLAQRLKLRDRTVG